MRFLTDQQQQTRLEFRITDIAVRPMRRLWNRETVAILVNPKETIRSAEENSDEIQGRAKKATLIAGKWEFPRLSSINTPLTHRCLNSVEADAADVLPSLQGFGYLRGVMDSNGQSFTESHRSSSPNHRRH
jgi:hypothetical protein